MRIGLQAKGRWDAFPNSDHRPPFREARPQGAVFGQTITQAIEPFGDRFTRKTRQSYSAFIHLDPGHDATLFQQGGERRAILRLLADGLVIENDTADEGLNTRGRKQELAIDAAVLLRRGNVDTIE